MDKPDSRFRQQTLGSHQLRPESLMMGYGYESPSLRRGTQVPVVPDVDVRLQDRRRGQSVLRGRATASGRRDPVEEPGLIYSRINNPDLQILEDRLTLWEGAEAALAFSSGMAAIVDDAAHVPPPG